MTQVNAKKDVKVKNIIKTVNSQHNSGAGVSLDNNGDAILFLGDLSDIEDTMHMLNNVNNKAIDDL